jgi:hypothetical protein
MSRPNNIEALFKLTEKEIVREIEKDLCAETTQVELRRALQQTLDTRVITELIKQRISRLIIWFDNNREIEFPNNVIEIYLYHYLHSREITVGRPNENDIPPPLSIHNKCNNFNNF